MINKLTPEVFARFGNRKKPGRIGLFVDTRNGDIYAVPKHEEHLDFIKQITDEQNFSKIIPSYIDLKEIGNVEKIFGVETGYSGVEIRLGIRHTPEDLQKAHSLTHVLVSEGEIPLAERIDSKITYKFSSKRKTA